MLNRMNLFETHRSYLYNLNGIGSSLNNNKHIEATLFMVAKALLWKIKLLFEKKTMGEKWPVSQQPPPTIPPLAPPLFMLRQRTGPPSIPETGVEGQHGPLDIPYDNTPGCVMWGGGAWFLYEKDRKTDRMMRERWEVKSLRLGKTGRHRSWDQHAGHLFWNPFTRFMPWVVKSTLLPAVPEPPHIPSLTVFPFSTAALSGFS